MSEPYQDPLVGRLVANRYRVLKPLGEGGMGQVYLAEHEAIEKKVALKVLRPEYSRKEDIVTRFQQEAISASRIKHPNVLDVFDFGKLESGEAFLAMEFLEGRDLSDELAKVGMIDPQRGTLIALQVCRALAAAHSRGVVHRDMKPENVFLQRTADGEEMVKIVDFGIAQLRTTEEAAKTQQTRRRLTKTGMIFGTPEYMSPEQAAGRPTDLRVDVYAVGVILYEMFTGAVPFTGESFMQVLARTLNDPPPPMRKMNGFLAISPELEAVVEKALAKEPEDRFETMGLFIAALLATPEGEPFARMTGPLMEPRLSSYPPAGPGQPTAAQFSGGRVATAELPETSVTLIASEPTGGTQAIGTPEGAASARSATPSGVRSSTGAPSATSNRGLVFGSAFGLLALAAGGYALFGRTEKPREPEKPAVVVSPEPSPPPQPSVTAAPTAEITPVNMPPNEVRLHVVTEPDGAEVSKGGFQVCAATPCDVVVPRLEGVELEAKKGALKGQVKVLAQQDQTITIPLAAPLPKKPATPKLCEIDMNGLKILRPCPK
jgi:serine/threonine-protein kinase